MMSMPSAPLIAGGRNHAQGAVAAAEQAIEAVPDFLEDIVVAQIDGEVDHARHCVTRNSSCSSGRRSTTALGIGPHQQLLAQAG